MKNNLKLFIALSLVFCFSLTAFAQKKDDKEIRDAGKRADQAARVFRSIMDKPDKSIPRELLERAEAVAVFPGVLGAAFIVGGSGGEGLISRRTATGWSAPAFFKIGGGSVGFQIGAEKTDVILLIMNDGGLKGLLEDKFEFGGEAGVAAGPIGRKASATTNATLDAGILSYSRTKGAFVGAALKGGVLSPDNNKNRALYGKTSKEILLAESPVPTPDAVADFPQTLNRFSNRRANDGTNSETQRVRTVGTSTEAANPQTESDVYYVVRTPRRSNASEETEAARARDRLAREIRAELLMLSSYGVFDSLEFQILPDNSVVLRGVSTSDKLKSDAEQAVKQIETVTAVRNDIEVLQALLDDQRLRQELFRAVYSGDLARYSSGSLNPIHIVVRNGSVTLKGVVDSEADKNLAAVQANSVNGITGVKNELLVEN
ncbi:MAG TPA: YSC84-related protein [Pyrinomonadaceae bacterium]|jgi:lipid-binding SYLF domain-containing protein/osmotically-inducible protein OsmY